VRSTALRTAANEGRVGQQPDYLEELMPRIRRQAKKIMSNFTHGSHDVEDLAQVGAMAALRARPRWREGGGATWQNYAIYRTRGAMIDELRKLDHVPRLERTRAKGEGRELPVVLYAGMWDRRAASVVSLDRSDGRDDGPASDLWERVKALLPRRWYEVLRLYYGEGITLTEIGRIFRRTESWACQLVGKARRELRRRMAP
jgi:RNA polymerase sigma factor FliA